MTTVSVSQLAFCIARSMLPAPIWLPCTVELDAWFRRAIYGGKCLPTKQFFEAASGQPDDYLVLLDVVSLYPHVLRAGRYPVGVPRLMACAGNEVLVHLLREANRQGRWPGGQYGELAIVECDVKPPSNIVNPILPARAQDDGGGLVWDCAELRDQVYDSVLLDEALRRGYRLRAVRRLVAWDAAGCGSPFADYVTRCFELKRAAKKGTPAYATAKLMMNSLYGKLIQKPRNSDAALVGDLAAYNAFCDAHGDILDWHALAGTEKLFVSAAKRTEEVVVKVPSQVGVFVLSYAKAHLNKCVDALGGFFDLDAAPFYTDTDSLLVHNRQLEALAAFIGDGMGLLNFEVPGRIVRFALPYPKVYACEYRRFDNGATELHARAKGVSAGDGREWERFETYLDLLRGGTVTAHEERAVRRLAQADGDGVATVGTRQVAITLGGKRWGKRRLIDGHPCMASVPLAYAPLAPPLVAPDAQ